MSNQDKSIYTWSKWVILIFLILVGFLGYQIKYFEIDASAETLLVKNDRNYLITRQSDERYQPAEFILIAHKPLEKNIFSANVLDRVDQISEKIKKLPRVSDVRSIVNSPIFVEMQDFGPGVEPSEYTWKNKRFPADSMARNLKQHPLYEDLLINRDQSALSMQVVFKTPKDIKKLNSDIVQIQGHLLTRELTEKEEKKLEELNARLERHNKKLDATRIKEIDEIRKILKPYEKSGSFFLGGNNLLAYQLINIIKNDLVLFGGAVIILVGLILLFLFRKFRWVVLPLITCGVSVVMTLGLLGLLGMKVTVISANVIALQIILCLAMVIHLIEQYRELIQEDHKEGEELDQANLVLRTVKEKASPCFFAGLTTIVGFASLIFSGIQPVISFGWMMVMAMVITIFVSLILFPAMLITFFDVKTNIKKFSSFKTALTAAAQGIEKVPRTIMIFWAVVSIASVLGCFRLTAENSFINYFRQSTDVYRELSFIDKDFGGSTPLDILYTIPKKDRHPELLMTANSVQKITDMQNMLKDIKGVGSITSVADFARIAQVVSGKPLTEYELTAFYRTIDKGMRNDVFGAYYSNDHHQVRISTRVEDTTKDLDRGVLLDSIHSGMKKLGIKEKDYQLTSLFVLYEDVLSKLVWSQFSTLGIVYIIMTLLLIFLFRSLKVAIIAMIPNIITTAVIMGFMGLANIPLDLMTITIAAIAMGISVDDTIHYIHRFLRERQSKGDTILKTHLSVGYALVYTTVVITIGFGALVFSDFVPSILFGVLTGVAMIVALATDMTLLPILLDRFLPKDFELKKASS